MYTEILDSQIVQCVGEYGIVRSVEQTYLDNGNKIGGKVTWYDVCLDHGNGDIVFSCKTLKNARMWAKENKYENKHWI